VTTEFDLIARIRARSGTDASVLVGIGDDAAVVQPTSDRVLVASTDSLVPDRHFLPDWSPEDIGHLSLAVNLSDLAAMGATPRWSLLALTLPEGDEVWLDRFLDGFLALAERSGLLLVGGNLARGPLNIGVQVLGEVDPSRIARRSGSRPGDLIAVTGSLGDADAALKLGDDASPELVERLRRPQPRIAAGQAMAPWIHGMIDVSDGLVADLAHLLEANGLGNNCLGAELDLDHLPASPALLAASSDRQWRWQRQLNGGSDYELLMTLPPDHLDSVVRQTEAIGLRLTVIGRVGQPDTGLKTLGPDGEHLEMNNGGWDHFGS